MISSSELRPKLRTAALGDSCEGVQDFKNVEEVDNTVGTGACGSCDVHVLQGAVIKHVCEAIEDTENIQDIDVRIVICVTLVAAVDELQAIEKTIGECAPPRHT